jgi:hypothetical protein
MTELRKPVVLPGFARPAGRHPPEDQSCSQLCLQHAWEVAYRVANPLESESLARESGARGAGRPFGTWLPGAFAVQVCEMCFRITCAGDRLGRYGLLDGGKLRFTESHLECAE